MERTAFQRTRSELVPQLEEMKKKRAKHIVMASPYYQALNYLNKVVNHSSTVTI